MGNTRQAPRYGHAYSYAKRASSLEYNPLTSTKRAIMSAERFLPALGLWCMAGVAGAASPTADPALPFTIQDMVRMERISDVAVSPSGKHVAFAQRTTDMEANKGHVFSGGRYGNVGDALHAHHVLNGERQRWIGRGGGCTGYARHAPKSQGRKESFGRHDGSLGGGERIVLQT